MSLLIESIARIKQDLTKALSAISSIKELEDVKTVFLGRKGFITELMLGLKDLAIDEKRVAGQHLNVLRVEAESAVQVRGDEMRAQLLAVANAKNKYFDVTAYQAQHCPSGSLHIVTQFITEIEDIFLSMGFDVWDGPEMETEHYNFNALNVGADHPARDMQDTLWLNKIPYLLRTQTSAVQVHAMETKSLPLAGISSGRVYRQEAIDASHEMMFRQCEGMVVDKGINLSHLFGLVKVFLSRMFEKQIEIRIRPGFFPFVEPGLEIDMRCVFCKNGCRVCKQSTWIEVMPGGLVHPHVLLSGGIDPKVYSGIAFAIGIERMIMMRHAIYDIRLFQGGKIPFLSQF